jgi:arginyl-tRNA synthetase
MNLRTRLEGEIALALARIGATDVAATVVPAARPEFGDYQWNGAMAAAKARRVPPRTFAAEVAGALAGSDAIAGATVAGPGFVNLRVAPSAIRDQLALPLQPQAGTAGYHHPTVVIDYSAPNLVKELHVGHLRSSVIGDAIARVHAFLGHHVIRQNHVGDWGTGFGMLLAHLQDAGAGAESLSDLEAFYVAASARYRDDASFAERARACVVALQQGDAATRAAWQRFVEVSLAHCERVYARLGLTLARADVAGESSYNADLPGVVDALRACGLLVESDGAQCVFLPEFRGKDDRPLPFIVQKRDGGYLYATTDLAAIRHRAGRLHADRVLYFVSNAQSLHFRQLFAVARAAGFAPPSLVLEHCAFGSVLGPGGTPFRTRDGGSVKLTDLLDEAERRASALLDEKQVALDAGERERAVRALGIGAVKYGELSRNRTGDYTFDWDTVLTFEGNTAPYLQYAYTRIRSIFRRTGDNSMPDAAASGAGMQAIASLDESAERALALDNARFGETLDAVAADSMPHYLCAYLYGLAGAFMRFYEQCPVLDAPAATRASRLALCARTAATLQAGLGLLGIETLERM